jgi:spore coat protein U-like protein
VTDEAVTYSQSGNVDTNGTATINCTRSSGDANSLSYRIKADNGLNASGNQLRVRLGATANYINYSLARGTSVGGAASCNNSTTWDAPATGTTNVITGTLNFGANLSASAVWGYCLRVRPVSPTPASGIYTDTVQIFGQYPNSNSGTLTASAPLNYSVSVGSQCQFGTTPSSLTFDYTSFSTAAQTASGNFNVLCSNTLPWTVSITPENDTLLGLNYSLSLNPAAGTGTGLNQLITLTGTIPAGQVGSCNTAVCTASKIHTVTISY